MNTEKIVKLVLESSDFNPYSGALSKRGNIIAAIELSKLFKEFADGGYASEAMDIDSIQWILIISELEDMLHN